MPSFENLSTHCTGTIISYCFVLFCQPNFEKTIYVVKCLESSALIQALNSNNKQLYNGAMKRSFKTSCLLFLNFNFKALQITLKLCFSISHLTL